MKISTRIRRLDEIENELDVLRGRRGTVKEYSRKSTLYRLRKRHNEILQAWGERGQVSERALH